MPFGSSPRDSSNVPISSSYVPNTGLVAAQGSPNTNTDASGNVSTPVLVGLAASYFTSGTLQNAQNSSSAGTALSVLGMACVVFTVNMAGFTGTVTFKASEDGTNYDPINVTQAGTNTIGSTAVGSTTTSIHCYDASIAGYQSVEAVTSGVTAGTVTVTAHAIPINLAPRTVNVAGTITANNASIGTDGSTLPTSSTLIGASDGTNLQQLLVESASNRNLRVALYNGSMEAGVTANGLAVQQTTAANLNATATIQAVTGTSLAADQSNSELRASLYGKNSTAGDTALFVDSAGRLNIQQMISYYIMQGQGFSATTGKQTSSGSGNGLACLFSPASATKNILIYSITAYCVTAGTVQFSAITADPALGSSITPVNDNFASATTSIATAEYTATIGSLGGTTVFTGAAGNNTVLDLLGVAGNPSYIYLPSGQAGIHGVEVAISTSTNAFAINFRWIEF